MAIQLATSTRNARLDAVETDAGTAAVLRLRTGAQPANCAAADSGSVIISYSLAADWAAAAASGSKSFSNTPISGAATGANADGQAFHFRLYKSDGTTCIMQGSVTQSGGGGDLTIDNDDIEVGQTVNVTSLTLTDGNA
jgi:hypothetical protein